MLIFFLNLLILAPIEITPVNYTFCIWLKKMAEERDNVISLTLCRVNFNVELLTISVTSQPNSYHIVPMKLDDPVPDPTHLVNSANWTLGIKPGTYSLVTRCSDQWINEVKRM